MRYMVDFNMLNLQRQACAMNEHARWIDDDHDAQDNSSTFASVAGPFPLPRK
jgi:hypothetical protein